MNKHVLKIQKELEEAKEKLARQHKRVSLVLAANCQNNTRNRWEYLLPWWELFFFLRPNHAELFVEMEEGEGLVSAVPCRFPAWWACLAIHKAYFFQFTILLPSRRRRKEDTCVSIKVSDARGKEREDCWCSPLPWHGGGGREQGKRRQPFVDP